MPFTSEHRTTLVASAGEPRKIIKGGGVGVVEPKGIHEAWLICCSVGLVLALTRTRMDMRVLASGIRFVQRFIPVQVTCKANADVSIYKCQCAMVAPWVCLQRRRRRRTGRL